MKNIFYLKGFTLVELLVSIAIIGILTAAVVASSPAAKQGFAIMRSSQGLAQDIRRAQIKATAMKEIGGSSPKGYGIYLATNASSSYILFADQDGNHTYNDKEDILIETINLETDVKISALSSGSSLNIVFEPPNPTVWVNNSSSSFSTITLHLENNITKTREIFVNSSGLITTQ